MCVLECSGVCLCARVAFVAAETTPFAAHEGSRAGDDDTDDSSEDTSSVRHGDPEGDDTITATAASVHGDAVSVGTGPGMDAGAWDDDFDEAFSIVQ